MGEIPGPGTIEACSSLEFAKGISDELDRGLSIVPLVGSGLSAPSNILTGDEMSRYLCYCATAPFPLLPNLIWPPIRQRELLKKKQDWVRQAIEAARRDPENRVLLDAVAAMGDWRTALHFLSRLRRAEAPSRLGILGAPDLAVVDSAFMHITEGRRPSMGHMMLAHLADVLRMQTLLTTNFDELIEQAFARLSMPLAAFDVHQKAGLPDPQLVLAQRAIVKLHGGKYGLRADLTLDEEPSLHDQKAFEGYLRRAYDSGDRTSRHLLVMGVSGRELRTLNLIHSAQKRLKNLQVFWICYTDSDCEHLRQCKLLDQSRIKATVQRDLGLFLLDLYQRLRFALPPAGGHYPAIFRVPPAPYSEVTGRLGPVLVKEPFGRHRERLRTDMEKTPLVAVNGGPGISSVAAKLFDELSTSYHCVWLELDHFSSVSDFLVALTEAVASNLGVWQALPPEPEFSSESCRDHLGLLTQVSSRRFVVFINGRDKPGSHAGFPSAPWNALVAMDLWQSLQRLATDNFRFVLLARPGSLVPPKPLDPQAYEAECLSINRAQIVRDVMGYLDEPPPEGAPWTTKQRFRFMYALTLFRHSRHPAALWSWGLMKAPQQLRADGGDNDRERAAAVQSWLSQLERFCAIRYQPGGSVWMHEDICQSLQDALGAHPSFGPYLKRRRAQFHQGIADWYVKLFRSSSDPLAALESLYHRLCSIEHARASIGAPLAACDVEDEDLDKPEELVRASIVEAVTTLKLARSRILSCGYFKTSSNLLDTILEPKRWRVFAGLPGAEELRRVCLELLRDFAREANDFTRADSYVADLASVAPIGIFEEGNKTNLAADDRMARAHRLRLISENAKCHAGLRSYDAAEQSLRGLLRELELQVPSQESIDSDTAVRDTRQQARAWVSQRDRSDEEIQLAVKALRRAMFLRMLIGQIHRFRRDTDRAKQSLRYAELLYTYATTLMRYVQDHEFLQVENAFIRTHYGILLAHLGRFSEGHRRLDEAAGYLWQSSRKHDAIAWAVLDLRRAESLWRQAQEEKDGDRATAFLEDARNALQRARKRLSGERRGIWWWAVLHELELTICAELTRLNRPVFSPICGDCRRCPDEEPYCVSVLQEGMRLNRLDPLRQARMMEMYLQIQKHRRDSCLSHQRRGGCTQDCPDRGRRSCPDRAMVMNTLEHFSAIKEDRQKEGLDRRYPLFDAVEQYISDLGNEALVFATEDPFYGNDPSA